MTGMSGRRSTGGLPSGSGVEIFEAHYAGEPGAGWEIERPQSALVRLARDGALRGRVLDVGCGSGDNALMIAEHGLETTGVDAAPSGIGLARRKARERGLDVRFLVWDGLALPDLGERFDTVVDVGFFHCFTSADRPAVAASIGAVVPSGGRYFLMCWSDREPGTWGPHRISGRDIEAAFADGWRIDSLEPADLEVAFPPGTVRAWQAAMTRL
ncbi:class I SAM-dependent methyltransferase [Streptomyces fenghuangensis]